MARNKYIYHHYVDNVETTKGEFKKALQEHFIKCDTHYDNPLLNIGYVDDKALERAYNHMKRTGSGYIYIIEGRKTPKNFSFRIKKEVVNEKD